MVTAPSPPQDHSPSRTSWRSLWAGTPRPGLGCAPAFGLVVLLSLTVLLYQIGLIGLRWPWPGQLAGWLGLLLGAAALLWAMRITARTILRLGLRGLLVRLTLLIGLAVLVVGLLFPTGSPGVGHWQLTFQRIVSWPANGLQALWAQLVEAPGEIQFATTGRRPPLVVPGVSWEGEVPPPLIARVSADQIASVPVSESPTEAPSDTSASMIAIGASVLVTNTDGAPLRARATPSREAAILTRFDEGTVVEVIDGPVEAEGLTWWRVQGPGGEGWCAADFLASR